MRKSKIWITLVIAFTALLLYNCGGEQANKESKSEGYSNKEAIENILQRKSVRQYLEREVEQEKVELMLRAGMAAPSGMDRRPWELIVIDDKEIMGKMAEELPYAKMLTGASLAIVVCGDTDKSDYWYLDCSAVTQNILLAAEALDLGAVWTAAYPFQERMEVVTKYVPAIPENIKAFVIIPIGYPDGEFTPKDKFDSSRIHHNKWSKEQVE